MTSALRGKGGIPKVLWDISFIILGYFTDLPSKTFCGLLLLMVPYSALFPAIAFSPSPTRIPHATNFRAQFVAPLHQSSPLPLPAVVNSVQFLKTLWSWLFDQICPMFHRNRAFDDAFTRKIWTVHPLSIQPQVRSSPALHNSPNYLVMMVPRAACGGLESKLFVYIGIG